MAYKLVWFVPEEWLDAFEEDGGLAVTFEVGDIKAAARATSGAVSDKGDYLIVPPERASGVIVKFAI